MGSHTIDILRQGFWASLTGGWFFDPHQDIFCNTFHMYLWLALLLTPFILYLTAESVVIPTVIYSLVVFIFFALIKIINHKLHILFDGEELLEVKSSENIELGEVPGTSNSENVASDITAKRERAYSFCQGRADQPDLSESSQANLSEHTRSDNNLLAPQINVSIKEEIENTLKHSETNDTESFSTLELPDNSSSANELFPSAQSSNSKYGSVSHRKISTGTAKENSNSDQISSKDEDTDLPSLEIIEDVHNDNNLIIANKPTVKNFENSPKPTTQALINQQFPLSLHKLVETSSDSSWGTSSDSDIDIGSNKVRFMPIDTKQSEPVLLDKDLGAVKSENSLMQKPSEINKENVATGKSISLSASAMKQLSLAEENENKLVHSSGRRTGVNESVGLSLPALPTLNEFLEEVNNEGPSTSYSNQTHSTSNNAEKEAMYKEPAMVGELDEEDYLYKIVRQLQRQPIRRRGAFRESSGDSRSYERVRQRTESGSPVTLGTLLASESENLEKENKHIAMSHEDTSTGAVHCFQDETGQWFSYAFGDGAAVPLQRDTSSDNNYQNYFESRLLRQARRNSSASNTSQQEIDTVIRELISNQFMWRSQSNPFSSSQFPRPSMDLKLNESVDAPPNKYYMLPIIGSYSIKISFDRLALLSLLDRNKNAYQGIFGTILASMVALLGYILLSRNYVYDFWIFVICFVIAKCQFSLLKSVQPDAASPIHGHNNTVVFSRAIYFCMTAILILCMDEASKLQHDIIYLYGVPIYSKETFNFAREALIVFLLAFPLIFLFGFLPQIDTFVMHVLEQINIHVFGGSAVTSLVASIFSFGRSVVVTVILSFICYASAFLADGKPGTSQHVLFSVFAGILVAISYHLSRTTSSPSTILNVLKKNLCCNFEERKKAETNDIDDPLPEKLLQTVETRLTHDSIVCIVIAFVVFAVHLSTVFTSLQPTLSTTLFILTGSLGVLIHYVIPQLRKQLPWLLLASPVMKPYEYSLYEWQEPSKIMWFEKLYVWLCIMEKNILYPIICMSELTREADQVLGKFGLIAGSVILVVCGVKILCNSFNNTSHQHIILIWTVLFFNFDFDGHSETFMIDYFFMAIFVEKMLELFLKFKFILTYTAPWQILWGSAFHAFAQPVSIPHCGMLFLQAVVSAFFSAPLNPLLGSAIFITSYMRPIKFWEKDYNTKRVDHSNTRLSSYIDNNPGADDNNLNSIFYEHLTRSLQHSLCGDLLLGRWGNFSSGDCFIMASDYLNALVHIIEVGNGYVTFQLRGLEFRGTYCQQREVEAITENVDDDTGCCCCHPGHLPNFLSFNTAFSQRWLAWEVVQRKYIIEGYSVSDNTATSMFQMFDLRKIFITYYVTSIIFYCVRNKKLSKWLSDESLMKELNELTKSSYVDVDAIFRQSTDKDFDVDKGGITRKSFCRSYLDWIVCCNSHRDSDEDTIDVNPDSHLVTLCYALSLLGRRLLSTPLNTWNAATLKSFLHGLHALFKGDFRVTSSKDDWVFGDSDLELLRNVVAPAVRMALKLHQDHFVCTDEFEDNDMLYETVSSHEEQYVICHEGHPDWRQAVLHNKPNLLALRYVIDDGSDDYKIIMLTKRCLNFRVIKVNKECVRGLWAGQLQELIFLRNRNPERGSIQNAKQALRNMINSSCDQPIGYPIYVSPLTTSYSETNPCFTSISFGNVNGKAIQGFFRRCYQSFFYRFAAHFARSNSQSGVEVEMTTYRTSPTTAERDLHEHPINLKPSASKGEKGQVAPAKTIHFRASSYTSLPSNSSCSSSSGSSHSDSLKQKIPHYQSEGKARLKSIAAVTEALTSRFATSVRLRDDLVWFVERANKVSWRGWYPQENMVGDIIYHWDIDHPNITRQCPFEKKLYLLNIDDNIVPVFENGVTLLGSGVIVV